MITACKDTRVPTETDPTPEDAQPRFDIMASSNGYTAIDLGTLGGTHSLAYAINNVGQVAGDAETALGEVHATIWRPVQTPV